MRLTSSITKEAYGHVWEYREENPTMRAHWKSSWGILVFVFPPDKEVTSWFVNIYDDECHEFDGTDAEERAFCLAEAFTCQKRPAIDITFRRAEEADIEAYVCIAKAVESPINLATTEPAEVRDEIKRFPVFMICCDNAPIGFISYENRGDRQAYIRELAVHPDFQRKSIGGTILGKLILQLTDRGFQVFSLVTHPDNPAKRLYERFGFVGTGETIENYQESGTPRIVMCRHV